MAQKPTLSYPDPSQVPKDVDRTTRGEKPTGGAQTRARTLGHQKPERKRAD